MKRDARTKAMGYAANNNNESVFQAIMYLISQGKHQEAERLADQHFKRHGANHATHTTHPRVPQLRR
jgi:hypothetical protein